MSENYVVEAGGKEKICSELKKYILPTSQRENALSEVARICSIIIFHLSKLLYEKSSSPYCVM